MMREYYYILYYSYVAQRQIRFALENGCVTIRFNPVPTTIPHDVVFGPIVWPSSQRRQVSSDVTFNSSHHPMRHSICQKWLTIISFRQIVDGPYLCGVHASIVLQCVRYCVYRVYHRKSV